MITKLLIIFILFDIMISKQQEEAVMGFSVNTI